MKASNPQWKAHLAGRLAPSLADEVDIFENEVALRKQGKIDEKVFAETRLRRGAYGQRYDNGQRHDGVESRKLDYPHSDLTKGPNTLWDAPGMQRIKVPFGGLNAAQLEVVAELAEEYSDNIAHVTTRQDFQLHFVHIEDTPIVMRRLASVGITTREACGNSVRNVTACPISGVCRDEAFDVTPYAHACTYFLLGHPDTQEFGRKFKVALSGCGDNPCALVRLHDLGLVAKIQDIDGKPVRGFEVYVGGGLGTVPNQAKLFYPFMPAEELLPLAQAISRVFARLGEKKNRNTARLKFLVNKLGLDEFKRLVEAERTILTPDPRWTSYLQTIDDNKEEPLRDPGLLQIQPAAPDDFRKWAETNVYKQRQPGYATITITLPLGDITSSQLRGLADIAREYTKETIRTTVEQNIVLRWVSESDVPAVYQRLKALQLNVPGASTISDVVSCPGTDTCKLGISSSRGLAGELRHRLADVENQAIKNLRIKISGCFNSCGQHHVADLGFYGVSRNKGGVAAPHFQVVLGGEWAHNAGAYGLAIGAVPSKRVPETVDRLTQRYVNERENESETFQSFARRVGKVELKKTIEDLMEIPPFSVDPQYYSDWHDPRTYSIGDMGVGECAGEVVSPLEFQLAASERQAFEAQLALDKGAIDEAADLSVKAMTRGVQALLDWRKHPHDGTVAGVAASFRTHLFDTGLFSDPFSGPKFGHYYLRAAERAGEARSEDSVRRLIEETQLVIEACHSCHLKLATEPVKV